MALLSCQSHAGMKFVARFHQQTMHQSLRRFGHSSTSLNVSPPVLAGMSSTKQHKSSLWRAAKWATGATLSAAAAFGLYEYNTNEGVRRSALFWRKAFPVYAHYRATQILTDKASEEEKDKRFNELHDRYADILVEVINDLRGFYIKLGQVGATRGDFLPPQYLDRVSTLQDQCPSEPWEYVKATIESELGKPLEEVFEYVDTKPLGAASIGQTHRARLKGSKTDVVIKVMYPKVESLFRGDVSTIRTFCELAQPAHLPLLDEVEKQFMTEFDYAREADNLIRVRQNLRNSKFKYSVVLPEPIPELCAKRVLVMEYLPGIKLIDAIKKEYEFIASQRGVTMKELEAEHRELMKKGLAPPSPSEKEINAYKRYLFTKDLLANTGTLLYNYTLGLIAGKQRTYHHSRPPLNIPGIVNLLLDVHAHEIFVDGLFNGDPHPGNILLLPDGRLGLIDYGQVKELGPRHRKLMSHLIIALADGNQEEAVKYMRLSGAKTKYNDPFVLWKLAVISFDKDDSEVLEGQNIVSYLEYLDARDPVVENDDNFVMATRVSLLMRGLGTLINYPISVAKVWRPFAEQFIKDHPDVDIHGETSPAITTTAL